MGTDTPLIGQLASGNLSEGFWEAAARHEAILVVDNAPAGPELLGWHGHCPSAWYLEGRDSWQSTRVSPVGVCSLRPEAVPVSWPAESCVGGWAAGPLPARVLLPIHPRHAENILAGLKKFEYRRVRPARRVASLVIYETSPVMAVVGEVGVLGYIEGPKAEVWSETSAYGGITRAEFDAYYADRETAFAYRLGDAEKYPEPRPLSYYGLARAPQSYAYL